MANTVRITEIVHETHDVLNIYVEKPAGFEFTPGQATEVSINKPGWEDAGRPFTFVCLPSDDYLEFMIKSYPDHDGVTKELASLQEGDELILADVFGAIHYRGEGSFIAGGAGVTPFISIIRELASRDALGDNKLIFANRSRDDIILQDEFRTLLGERFINILEQQAEGHANGRITAEFLEDCGIDVNGYIYLCGPRPMMNAVKEQLYNLGVDGRNIVQEKF